MVLFVRSKSFRKKKKKLALNCPDSLILLYYWVKTFSKLKTPFGETPWLMGRNARHWSHWFLVPRVLRIWESVFYSQALFTLRSFLLVLRPSRGRQFNRKVTRASRRSSKHSPGPAICLNHNNPQKGIVIGSI